MAPTVVNIITRAVASGLSAGVGAETGSFDTEKLNGFGGGPGDVFMSMARHRTDGINARVFDSSGETDGYENTTLHAKAGYQLADKLRGQLVLRDVTATSEYDGFASNNYLSHYDQTTGRLSLAHLGEALQQRLSLA